MAVNYSSNRGTLISETFSLVGLIRILGFCENLCFSRILNCTRILQNPLEILEGKSSSFRSGFSRTRFFTICSKELGLIAECSGILSLEVIAGFALALRAVFRNLQASSTTVNRGQIQTQLLSGTAPLPALLGPAVWSFFAPSQLTDSCLS